MPCRYYTEEEEREMATHQIISQRDQIRSLEKRVRELSVIADELGDLLQTLWFESDHDAWKQSFQDEVNAAIERQIKHRQDDLDRLSKVWKSGKKLAAVKAADPRYPLKPQLGFDPDDH